MQLSGINLNSEASRRHIASNHTQIAVEIGVYELWSALGLYCKSILGTVAFGLAKLTRILVWPAGRVDLPALSPPRVRLPLISTLPPNSHHQK